jgi:hypothetical protein
MNDLSVLESPLANAKCWRIAYHTKATEESPPVAILQEPCNRYVIADEVDVSDALADSAPEDDAENDESLLLIWLPRAASSPPGIANRVETWVQDGAKSEQPLVRASIRTVLVLWTERRAVIYSTQDELDAAINSVVRFTVAARRIESLERQLATAWTDVENHVALTHASSSRGLRMQSEVNDMTERATRMKVVYLRLENALQQSDAALRMPAKLLFSELALQARLPERLDLLDEPIQFLLDHYELSNTRLIEGRFNRSIFWLEVGIVVIIAADLVALIFELIK